MISTKINHIGVLLTQFSQVTLEQMNDVKLLNRVETKFLLSIKELPDLLEELTPYYHVVNINDELISEYKTVYYDDEDLYFYNEHHRRRKDRYKIRFRNYVSSELTFLEIKHKKNGRTSKDRIRVDEDGYTLTALDRDFINQAELEAERLRISLINSYQRITLVSKSTLERVTLDLNIQFYHDEQEANLDQVVIIELKQDQLTRTTPMFQALKSRGVRPNSMSKYCIGLIKTHGKDRLKYNRFKKKLIQIDKINAI